jgi:hypothetical protein
MRQNGLMKILDDLARTFTVAVHYEGAWQGERVCDPQRHVNDKV